MSFEATAILLAWVAITLLGLALSGLLRQIHELQSALTPQVGPIGTIEPRPVPELAPSRAAVAVAVFSEPHCASCSRLLPIIDVLADESESVEFAVVFPEQGNGSSSPRVQLLENRRELFDALRIPVTPFALVVDRDGSIRESSPVGSPSALESFVRSATNGGRT